jgi:uncharacterized heparinase superfamily protein
VKLAQYARTLRYLRPQQIYARVWFRAYRPRADLRPAPPVRTRSGHWRPFHWRRPVLSSDSTHELLNRSIVVRTAADWDAGSEPKLLRYNLHYFDDLNAINPAARASWHRSLISRWIRENPPRSGLGWDSYPTSLRIVNWIKAALATVAGEPGLLDSGAMHSLAVQARWLSKRLETHLLGNHLWANAKALAFAGMFFDGPEATRWIDTSRTLIDRELQEQILPDGGHFERSPMYHAIVLEDVLDLINLTREFPGSLPHVTCRCLEQTATRMLRWLQVMTHPDGRISFFNDAAFGIAPTYADLTGYARVLSLESGAAALGPVEPLADSGFVRLQNDRAVVICDVGPIGPDYLPAHAHADTLSFELSVDGRRVLVNSGCSTYDVGAERERQRGTAAHNSVMVDGENSSEMWGSFRVARRARTSGVSWGSAAAGSWVKASHDGYQRLPGRVTHGRCWTLESGSLLVDDRLEGTFSSAVAYWHPHPDLGITQASDGTVRFRSQDGLEILMSGSAVTRSEPSSWHPEFGLAIANSALVTPVVGQAQSTRFQW